MKIILYRSLAEREIVDKRSYIYKVYEVDGFFRDIVDVISPVVRIELTYGKTSSLPKFNYAYISVLNKYYFIDNIVIVRTNEKDTNNITIMYELYLSEDALTTFQSNIYSLNVVVNRQEYEYNEYIKDTLLPCSVIPTIEEYELVAPQNKGTNRYNYILTVAAGFFDTQEQYKPTDQNPNAVYSDSYLFTQEQIMTFGKKLMGGNINLADIFSMLFNDPSQGIINLTLLPFNIDKGDGVKLTKVTSITIGKGIVSDVPCQAIYDTKYIDKKIGDFTIEPKYNNFLDYSPYTTIEIYLPFYGFLDMDTNLIIGKTCEIHYVIDIISGSTKIKIIDNITKHIYYTVNCQVGIQISMTSSNIAEKIRNIATTAISIGAGVVGLGTANSLSALNAPRMYTPKTGRVTKAYAKYSVSEGLKSTQRNANFVSETTSDIVSSMQNHIKSGAASNEITEWADFDIGSTTVYNFKIYWRVRRITPITIDNYNRLIGKPSAVSGTVMNFLGYTEISACHFENLYDCLTDEINIIEDNFRNGIIINNTHKVSISVVDFLSGNNILYDYFSIRNTDNKILFLSQNSSSQDVYVDSNTDTEYWVSIKLKDNSISKIVQTVETNSTAIEIEYRKPTSPFTGWLYFWLKIRTTTNGNFNDLSLKVRV